MRVFGHGVKTRLKLKGIIIRAYFGYEMSGCSTVVSCSPFCPCPSRKYSLKEATMFCCSCSALCVWEAKFKHRFSNEMACGQTCEACSTSNANASGDAINAAKPESRGFFFNAIQSRKENERSRFFSNRGWNANKIKIRGNKFRSSGVVYAGVWRCDTPQSLRKNGKFGNKKMVIRTKFKVN